MEANRMIFLSGTVETVPWLVQVVLIALAYICTGGKSEGHKGRTVIRLIAEFVLVSALLLAGSLLIMAFVPKLYILLWGIYSGLVLAGYLVFFSGHRTSGKVIIWCSMFASLQTLSSISGAISYLAGAFIGPGTVEAVVRSGVYVLLIFVALYLEAFHFDEFRQIPITGMLLILVGDVFLLISGISENFFWQSNVAAVIRPLVLDLALFGLTLLAVYVLHNICLEQEENELLRESRQKLLSERERFTMAEQQIEEIRSIRHDLKNQRHYMKILLDEGRYEDLKRYFDQSSEQLPTPEPYVKCGNKSVNVILNMEFAKIGPEIELEHLLVVPPVLPFKDEELCSLITNLLDNAIEECRKLVERGNEKPKIRFEIYPESNFLYILCQNTTDRTRLETWRSGLRSTKADAVMHGYGTQIVAGTAEKYGGCAEYSLKDGLFVAKVLLDMMGESADAENRSV